MASPVFAVSAVPVADSAAAFVVAARASGLTAEVAAVVCAESPVVFGHRRCAVVVFAGLADVSARCAASPGLSP